MTELRPFFLRPQVACVDSFFGHVRAQGARRNGLPPADSTGDHRRLSLFKPYQNSLPFLPRAAAWLAAFFSLSRSARAVHGLFLFPRADGFW